MSEDVITDEELFMAGKVIVASPVEDEIVSIPATYGPFAENIVSESPSPVEVPGDCTFTDTSCASEAADLEFTFVSCLTAEITPLTASTGAAPGNTRSLLSFFMRLI